MSLISKSGERFERRYAQVFAFFALTFFAPLPLASNRPWALVLLAVLTGGLWLWSMWRSERAVDIWGDHSVRLPVALLGGWLLLLGLQQIPLPAGWFSSQQGAVFGHQDGLVGADILSSDGYSSRLYVLKAVLFALIFWLTLVLVNSRRRIEWLARVIVLSGLIQALAGVVMMASGATFQLFFVPMDDTRAHGTFASPDHFAGYLELTLAVGIGLMIAKLDGRAAPHWRKRLHGWLALLISGKAMLRLALIIMVVGLVASRSRMGNAAFFSSLLVVGLVTVIFAKHAARTTLMFITSLIILDVVIIGGVVGVEKVVQRIQNTNLESQAQEVAANQIANPAKIVPHVLTQEESVEHRILAARSALPIIRDFPWLGAGGGVFQWVFPPYQPGQLLGLWEHVHNDFVEFASETGLLGFAMLAALVMHSVWCSGKLLLHSRDQLSRGMAFASLMGVISLLIHGTVDFNLQITANAMLFVMVLSLPYLLQRAQR